MRLAWIIAFSLLGSVGALRGAGVLFAFPKLHERFKTLLLAYAIGALLGAVFLGLLLEAVKESRAEWIFIRPCPSSPEPVPARASSALHSKSLNAACLLDRN